MNGRFYKLQRPSMQLKNKTLTMNSTLSIHKNREMGNIKKQNKTIYINGKAFKLLKKKKSIKERTKEISEEIKENLKELRKCKENKKYYWHEFMKKYYQQPGIGELIEAIGLSYEIVLEDYHKKHHKSKQKEKQKEKEKEKQKQKRKDVKISKLDLERVKRENVTGFGRPFFPQVDKFSESWIKLLKDS